MTATEKLGSSFKDPSGFVVRRGGEFWRVVQPVYREHYETLMQSGLCQTLVEEQLLIPHEEQPDALADFPGAWKILRPRQLGFISYPYEWSFSQLQDAALVTLRIQKLAVAHGLSLKDATAFNIQFVDGRPMLIDTLSFEKLPAGRPWVAYAQFCRHFLAPLALIAYRDARLGQLARVHLDGVPLDLASALLPWRTRRHLWLLVHLHWHAASQKRFADRSADQSGAARNYSLNSLRGLLDSLETAVNKLHWSPPKKVWGNYYEATVTGGRYVEDKKKWVAEFLRAARPASVWDLGSNTGAFSRLASDQGVPTVSFDGDPDCVEINYLEARKNGEKHLLPLLLDLTNPSPALGWAHAERMSWTERSQPDLVLALAVVHHLAIGHNLPLDQLVDFFHGLSRWLIIEFVPKNDPNAQKLLRVREDIFMNYNRENFEREFAKRFVIERSQLVQDSERVLYLMRRSEEMRPS